MTLTDALKVCRAKIGPSGSVRIACTLSQWVDDTRTPKVDFEVWASEGAGGRWVRQTSTDLGLAVHAACVEWEAIRHPESPTAGADADAAVGTIGGAA